MFVTRYARFLGLRDDGGDLYPPDQCSMLAGDVILVTSRGSKLYPWELGKHLLRENEVEILQEKKVNLNDYL